MPLRKLISEHHISPEIARVMNDAFKAVLLHVSENDEKTITDSALARKVFDAVVAGERDAEKIAADILGALPRQKRKLPRRNMANIFGAAGTKAKSAS